MKLIPLTQFTVHKWILHMWFIDVGYWPWVVVFFNMWFFFTIYFSTCSFLGCCFLLFKHDLFIFHTAGHMTIFHMWSYSHDFNWISRHDMLKCTFVCFFHMGSREITYAIFDSNVIMWPVILHQEPLCQLDITMTHRCILLNDPPYLRMPSACKKFPQIE